MVFNASLCLGYLSILQCSRFYCKRLIKAYVIHESTIRPKQLSGSPSYSIDEAPLTLTRFLPKSHYHVHYVVIQKFVIDSPSYTSQSEKPASIIMFVPVMDWDDARHLTCCATSF